MNCKDCKHYEGLVEKYIADGLLGMFCAKSGAKFTRGCLEDGSSIDCGHFEGRDRDESTFESIEFFRRISEVFSSALKSASVVYRVGDLNITYTVEMSWPTLREPQGEGGPE